MRVLEYGKSNPKTLLFLPLFRRQALDFFFSSKELVTIVVSADLCRG